jgi:hypothetical protein
MDMNNTPKPGMPGIKNLELLDLMGVISSPCINEERQHQSLGYRTPASGLRSRMPVDMWTIGFADRLRLRPHPHRHNRQPEDLY